MVLNFQDQTRNVLSLYVLLFYVHNNVEHPSNPARLLYAISGREQLHGCPKLIDITNDVDLWQLTSIQILRALHDPLRPDMNGQFSAIQCTGKHMLLDEFAHVRFCEAVDHLGISIITVKFVHFLDNLVPINASQEGEAWFGFAKSVRQRRTNLFKFFLTHSFKDTLKILLDKHIDKDEVYGESRNKGFNTLVEIDWITFRLDGETEADGIETFLKIATHQISKLFLRPQDVKECLVKH